MIFLSKIFLAVFVRPSNNKAPGGSTNGRMRLPHDLKETKELMIKVINKMKLSD